MRVFTLATHHINYCQLFLQKHRNDFTAFADICFLEFGDRVKHWITLYEPWTFASAGYDTGMLAPGRHSGLNRNTSTGNSATEPYIVGHNLLLSHSSVVRLYKRKYQVTHQYHYSVRNFYVNFNFYYP